MSENVMSDDMWRLTARLHHTSLSPGCCNVILDLTSVYSQAEQSFPYEVLCQRVPTNIGNILSLEFDHAPCWFYV